MILNFLMTNRHPFTNIIIEMIKKISKSKSETLFEAMNRQSLQKLKTKSKVSYLLPQFSKTKHTLVQPISKIQLPIVKDKSKEIVQRKTNLSIRTSQHHSLNKLRSLDKSSSASKIVSFHDQEKSKEKAKLKTQKTLRPQSRQMTTNKSKVESFGQDKNKPALKISKFEDFKSIIPQTGFIESTEKFDKNFKQREISISSEGVLQKNITGWQFKTVPNYELYIKKVNKLVNLQFFKHFYRVRIFNKWKRLSKHLKKQAILKFLSTTLAFSNNNITIVLKQQQILTNLTSKHFIMNTNRDRDSIEKDEYSAYLFTSIEERLKELKLKAFEEFFMELILNLRKIIQDHQLFEKEETNFKLSDLAFEDYFIRKNIQDHQIILRKFIYRYQEVKIQIVFQLLEEILSRIKYNIEKWNSNFTTKFTLFDAINAEFSEARSEELDYACFSHETKIKQIIIHITANQQITMVDFRQVSEGFVFKFIEQVKQYLRERYDSGYNCQNDLTLLIKSLLPKKIISEREHQIFQKCIGKIDTYCFAEYFKRLNEEISTQINNISDIIKQNLTIVIEATKLIQKNFLSIIDELITTQISYKFEYCNYIEKLTQKVSKIPLKLKMGMYCLDLQATIEYYEATIKKNYSIVLNQCLNVFQNKIRVIDSEISQFDENINISSWTIREFISSFKNSNDYNFYFENVLRDSYKDLDSILLTIHRVQPRFYEQSYLDLFHCKQRSEIVRSKSLCFLREINYKLNYLLTEKQKRVTNISSQINKLQTRMMDLVTSDSIEFHFAYETMTSINDDLQIQGKQIQELTIFIEIERSHAHKETKQIQFLAYQKMQNQVSLLLKLLASYKEFEEFLNRQLERDYNSFRLELLVDCIHNEISKIKQSIRFLHHYQKFLVNISAFYQADNTKVRLLRLIMQLQIEDLVKLDKKNFVMYEKYSAKHMLQYVKSQDKNQNIIKLFLEEKEYTSKVKEKIMSIQTKITKFLIINSIQNFDQSINPDLTNFIQMLQRNESQLEDYVKNQHLKELKTQIYDFLGLLRKSIRFLAQYVNIFQLYTVYQSYLKKSNSEERVVNKFLNMFKEQNKELTEICEKWSELNISIRQINLKAIVEQKYELQIQRIYGLQTLIKIEMNKINLYLTKRIEEFPLFNLLPTELLINVVNQPLLFLQYIHTTVKEVYWDHSEYSDSQKSSIIIRTIYEEKLVIPLESSEEKKTKTQKDVNCHKKMLKVQLQACMQQISSTIKNSILNLITNSFEYFIELIFTQKLPLQVIFASDQINNHNVLTASKYIGEVISNTEKEIQTIISYKDKEEISRYEMLLIDTLLISKLQFKNNIENNNEIDIYQFVNLQKCEDEVYLEMNTDSIRLEYQLIDPFHFTIIEPINYRTFIKLYQSIIQLKSCFLFEPFGLQNLSVRLMRHLFIISDQNITFETAINLLSKETILFYFRSSNHETEAQFFQKVGQAYNILNNFLFDKEKRIRAKAGSMKSLHLLKPMVYIQIPVCLYQGKGKNMNDFGAVYQQLSVQQRLNFRVIQFYQPPIELLLKACLLAQGLNLESQMESKILQQLLTYKYNQQVQNNYTTSHQDFMLILKNITKSLSYFQKVQAQTIKIAFLILANELSIDDIERKVEKKKIIIFRNRALNGKNNQSILKWEETKLNQEFIKFSKKMDEVLEEESCIMVVGKSCTGKSYMIKLYSEMVNLEIRSERDRGRIGGSRLLKLEGVDLSMMQYDPAYATSQLKLIARDSKENGAEYLWLVWLDGLERLDGQAIEQILNKNWLVGLSQIDCKLVIELCSLSSLSPRMALAHRQIVIHQKSFSVLEIIHANKQEVMSLLSDSILHKMTDPFTVFYRLLKDFFIAVRKMSQRVFIIAYNEEMIVIHTFQLLIGIIKQKSPKIKQHFDSLKEEDKIQALRKLFAFCFLWITSSLVQDAFTKKYEEIFLQGCRKEGIDTANIGSSYVINHKSEIIEYVALKSARNTLLKAQELTLNGNTNVFVHTYQSIILHNLLLFVTCNSASRVMVVGERQAGKTALLQHFTTSSSRHHRHFHYICSLYTATCMRDFNRSLKEMNSVFQREKVEVMLRDGKQMRWLLNLANTKCVFVENIALDLWPSALAYFNYIATSERILVDAQHYEFRNLHLLLQRSSAHSHSPAQQHFLRVRVAYEEGYWSEVFYGVYQLIGKNCSVNTDTCYQILKVKGAIVKNLLLLMKMVGKKVRHSVRCWTYFYHLTTLKHILQQLKNKEFRSKGEFLEGLFQEVEFQLSRRVTEESGRVTLCRLLENCRAHIKQDLRQEFILQEPSYLRCKEEEIILKLTNYLEYRNQFKNLKKSKTLVANLTHFYEALNKKPLIFLNATSIPGVGPFLPVAVEILGLQLIEVTSLEQFKQTTSESQRYSPSRSEDITLYYLGSWVLQSAELLAFLSNKVRNLEYSVRVRKNKRLSQILGTTANQNKCFFIVEYSGQLEQQQFNLLSYDELMKSATFLHLESPARHEQLQELTEFLGKEREELNVRQNETILSKIKRIYDILENEELLRRMSAGTHQYLFSIENYFRFIKIITDTYFERKYQIQSSLAQLQLALLRLDDYLTEHSSIKAKNAHLRAAHSDSRRRISALTDSHATLAEHLAQLNSDPAYLSLKDKKKRIKELEKTKQKMLHKEQQLFDSIESYRAIPRMEIANLKSLYSNSQSYGRPLFQALSLLICDSDDPAAIKRTLLDINLNLRIKEINMKEKKEEIVQAVQQRLQGTFEQQEYKVCFTLVNWLRYSLQHLHFKRDLHDTLTAIATLHADAYSNKQASEIEASIQKANVELQEMRDRLEKEKANFKTLQAELKDSEATLKQVGKFSEIQHFREECEKERLLLEQEYKLCLQTSIYFSLQLNFIFPCDYDLGVGRQLAKGKDSFDSHRALIERLFLRWCAEGGKEAELSFFRQEIHRIFENKQKYEFIDKELDAEEGNRLIAKCKKIAKVNCATDHQKGENREVQGFLPDGAYGKLAYLAYVLSIRHNSSHVLLLDPQTNLYKYLGLGPIHRLPLKRNAPKHEASRGQGQPVTAYLLRPHESPLLDTNHHVLFVQLPSSAQQVVFGESRRELNGAGGYLLKINSGEFVVPFLESLKIIYVCREGLADSEVMHQFYCMRFEDNCRDGLQAIDHQILRYHLGKMPVSCGLFSCMKESTEVVISEFQMRRLVLTNRKERVDLYLQKRQKWLKFEIFEKCCGPTQKLPITAPSFLNTLLAMIEEWRTASRDWSECLINLSALTQYTQRVIRPASQALLQIHRVCSHASSKVRRGQGERSHSSFSCFLEVVREGLRFLLANEAATPLEKQLGLLERFVLQRFCIHSVRRELFTVALYIRVYSLHTDAANSFQLLNLFSNFNYDNFLEALADHRVDSYAQAAHLDVPVYKIQIEKMLKSLKEIRADRSDAARMHNKNLILCPAHIVELISNFEFKMVRREEGAEQSFRQLPRFTQLLLQKWLAPSLFLPSCWTLAAQWRQKHVTLDLPRVNPYTSFYFCDVKHWSRWIDRAHSRLEIVRIQQGGKVEEKVKENGVCIVVDQRQGVQQRGEGAVRQRLQEYLGLNTDCSLIVLLSEKYHSVLHDMLRLIHKTQDIQTIRAHCLETYELLSLLERTELETEVDKDFPYNLDKKTTSKVSAQQQNHLQLYSKWNAIKEKTLNNYSSEIERVTFQPVVLDIQNQLLTTHSISQRFIRAATAKLSLWLPPSASQLQNHTEAFQETHLDLTPPIQEFPSDLLSSDIESPSWKWLQGLMGGLAKNRMSINGYIRSKLAARFREAPSPNPPPKTKPRQPNGLQQIEVRYVFAQAQQRGDPSNNEYNNSVRRLSRMRTIKSRNSSQGRNQDDYQLDAFLHAKGRRLAAGLETAIDELLALWRAAEGERPLVAEQHELRRAVGSLNIEQFFQSGYEGIIKRVLQLEQVMALKEYKRGEVLFKEQDTGIFLAEVKDSTVLLLSPHCAGRRECEIVLKCYEVERCGECMVLGKRRSGQRMCVLLKGRMYEIASHNQLLVRDVRVPLLTISTGFDILQAKIYCRKIASELL